MKCWFRHEEALKKIGEIERAGTTGKTYLPHNVEIIQEFGVVPPTGPPMSWNEVKHEILRRCGPRFQVHQMLVETLVSKELAEMV